MSGNASKIIRPHSYSCSSVDELSTVAGGVSIALNEIVDDPNAEFGEWRMKISRELSSLKARVSLLEGKTDANATIWRSLSQRFQTEENTSMSKFIAPSKCTLGGIRAAILGFIKSIRVTRAVVLQLCLLAALMIAFIFVGVEQFFVADTNQRSPWKPTKVSRIINYKGEDPNVAYEMPYVFMIFTIKANESDDSLYWADTVNKTTTLWLEANNYFENRTRIVYEPLNGDIVVQNLAIEEVVTHFSDYWVKLFGVCHSIIRLRLADPDPSLGFFSVRLYPNMMAVNLIENLALEGFWLSVGRSEHVIWSDSRYISTKDVVEQHVNLYYHLDYKEKVVKSLDGTSITSFDNMVSRPVEESGWGFLSVSIKSDLLVEHWEEFIHYTYVDWFLAMGGLLSIINFVFFCIARRLPKLIDGEDWMGILPIVSISFKNYDNINSTGYALKELKDTHVY